MSRTRTLKAYCNSAIGEVLLARIEKIIASHARLVGEDLLRRPGWIGGSVIGFAELKHKIKWASQTISRFLSPLPDGSHSSRTIITDRLKRPTRELNGAGSPSSPIWSCSAWGLPCQTDCSVRGALLPHLFTLTDAETPAVYFLWHFP